MAKDLKDNVNAANEPLNDEQLNDVDGGLFVPAVTASQPLMSNLLFKPGGNTVKVTNLPVGSSSDLPVTSTPVTNPLKPDSGSVKKC